MIKKITAILLAASIAVSILTGCSSSTETYLTDENGNPVTVDSIVTIDGEKIALEELRYYILASKAYYSNIFEESGQDPVEFWKENPDMMDVVKEEALDTLKFSRVVKKYAAENDIKLSAQEKQVITDEINSAIKQEGGRTKFKETLAQQFMTEKLYRILREDQLLQKKIQDVMLKPDSPITPTEEEAKAYLLENYLRAKHILISTQELTDEAEIAAKKLIADKALERAQAGEDFDALITELGEDPGMASNPDGYVFTDGEMIPEFYEGTKALADNGISGLVEGAYGWHIIKRLPLDGEYFETNKETLLNTVYSAVAGPKLNEAMTAIMGALVVEKSPEYETINATNLK